MSGGIFENDSTLHRGSGFYTHTYQTRTPRHAVSVGPRGAMTSQPRIPGGIDKIIADGVLPP